MSWAVSSSPFVWHIAMSPAAITTGSGEAVVSAPASGIPSVTSGGTSRAAGSQRHRRGATSFFTSATLLTVTISGGAGTPLNLVQEAGDETHEGLRVVAGGEVAGAGDPGEAGVGQQGHEFAGPVLRQDIAVGSPQHEHRTVQAPEVVVHTGDDR